MLRIFYMVLHHWHLFQQKHYELLVRDCLCEKLKMELLEKVYLHEKKAHVYANLYSKRSLTEINNLSMHEK